MFGANLNICTCREGERSSVELGMAIKYMSEIYLDTTSIINNSSSDHSPISTETSLSQFSPNTLNTCASSPLFTSPTTSTVDSSILISPPRTESCIYFNGKNEDFGMKIPLISSQHINVIQEEYKVDQGHLAQYSHPQIYSEAIYAKKQHKNEISKSLKMFAMLASYKYGNDSLQSDRESPICDIMEDFYCNGYVTDDANSFGEETPFKETSHLEPNYNCNQIFCNDINRECFNTVSYETCNKGVMNPSTNNNKGSVLKNYFDPNYLMMQLATSSQYYNSSVAAQSQRQLAHTKTSSDTGTAATVVAAANIAYNSQNIKRSQKRFGGVKSDKFSAVKHCVFCENNNEPEAVVKSHAVRDSLGRVLCPKLRTYICPICKASGDKAHTVKYCPQKPIITMEDAVKAESLRLGKNLYFKQ